MSDYLYYCGKCNSLVADDYEDDDIACEKCGARMSPLHIEGSFLLYFDNRALRPDLRQF